MPSLTFGLDAEVVVDGKVVEGVFVVVPGSAIKVLGGRLTSQGGVSVTDLVSHIAPALPRIPLTITVQEVLFVCEQKDQQNKYLFGVAAGAEIYLANLPLAGPMIRKALPANQTVSIDQIQLLVTSAAF